MVDEIRIAWQVPAIEHLVLVAHVHIEVSAKGFIDAEKETVLVKSGPRPFPRGHADRIQVDKHFIIGDQRPIRGLRDGKIRTQHLTESHCGAVCMLDPPFFQPGAA